MHYTFKLTLTSVEGCSLQVNGTVEYTLLPLEYKGFSGTVTSSGGEGCPNGTMTFRSTGAPSSRRLKVTLDKKDLSKLSKITWRGDSRVSRMLNERAINLRLCKSIKSHVKKSSTRKK